MTRASTGRTGRRSGRLRSKRRKVQRRGAEGAEAGVGSWRSSAAELRADAGGAPALQGGLCWRDAFFSRSTSGRGVRCAPSHESASERCESKRGTSGDRGRRQNLCRGGASAHRGRPPRRQVPSFLPRAPARADRAETPGSKGVWLALRRGGAPRRCRQGPALRRPPRKFAHLACLWGRAYPHRAFAPRCPA